MAEMAPLLGASSRQLARRFDATVGVSPKEFSRVTRFLRAVRKLDQGGHVTLTETALECGYFDQAHFNHDFREFAGITPREFQWRGIHACDQARRLGAAARLGGPVGGRIKG